MPTSRLGYLFNKYIHNDCSLSERYEFLELLRENQNDEELKVLLAELAASTAPHVALPDASGEAILQSILGNDFTTEEPVIQQPAKIKSLRTARWIAVAAASVILLFSIGYIVNFSGKKNITAQTTPSATVKVVVHTVTGESKNVQLPDGTNIWLSPSSSLEYPSAFASKTREVYLSGEAFFEVAHNAEQPFIIHSGTLQTKVLGTSFNIQAYDDQENIAVTVVTGKVKVSNDKEVENIELLPNQRAVFDKKTDKLIKENTDSTKAPEMLRRKEGTFVYRDEPLHKVAKDIETYFGITVVVPNAIKDCHIAASFEITDTPTSALKPIAISINGTLEIKDNTYTIQGGTCLN